MGTKKAFENDPKYQDKEFLALDPERKKGALSHSKYLWARKVGRPL